MSETLTLGELNKALSETETRIGKKIDDATVPYFNALSTDLNQISDHLDRIEKLLWQGERLTEIEARVVRLAELVGDASLARPFTPPIGTR